MSQPLLETSFLVVGAGMTGLAFANFLESDDVLVVERDQEIGGWCKTVHQDGFVWDYSGHFFHFKHPDIEAYLRERMLPDEVITVVKKSLIQIGQDRIDFPFQKNIHQLPKEQFIDCLYDLFFREEAAPQVENDSFKGMLYEKFGCSISELFLIPYNEKLYACDLEELDRDAMGRFFPYADVKSIVRNMRRPDNASYNATFTYPINGAIRYVEALAGELPPEKIRLGDGVESIDLNAKVATLQSGQKVRYRHLISSAPFDRLLNMSSLPHDPDVFTSNKVLVFNLGFDKKGPEDVHWIYFPERELSFYRVGFYDNIMNTDRMSLYVEVGMSTDAEVDVAAARERVLQDLKRTGIIDDHTLLSHHSVVLDPAYVHITSRSRDHFAELSSILKQAGVYSVGRYGGWTYCSIEDNIVEARALAERFNTLARA
ncbi:LPS biosynthesis protein [Lujinxingia litoralis]|uniref:LPS biosynthesis protein n=1 Tax=Lujinxingia litoralis TaxID=2211119 RepID=A0A328C8K2_9DELT|nr:FAD-dependent oxidoreductase [Lujinxingia litoralis]RAL22934.1 LPS biosynthesis protein [Lujinxingia litoralis]